MNDKLSLCFICKNNDPFELPKISQMLASVKPYISKICATVTLKDNEPIEETLDKILKDYGCIISTFKWCNDFSKARNFNFSQAETPYVYWSDADDLTKGGEHLSECIEILDKTEIISSIWFDYHYDFDIDGNPISIFPRERILRKDWYYWKSKLHERCLCKYHEQGFYFPKITVIHNQKHENIEEKSLRNLEIILQAYKEEKETGKLDPYTPYDVARALAARKDYEHAEKFFQEFLNLTDSDMDYFDCLLRLSDIYLEMGKYHKSDQACFLAFRTKYQFADPYINLGKSAALQEKYDQAYHWYTIAEKMEVPEKTGLPVNPLKYTADLWKYQSDALFFSAHGKDAYERVEKSLDLVEKAIKLKPNDETLKIRKERCEGYLNFHVVERGYLAGLDLIEIENNPEKLKGFISNLPKLIADHPKFNKLRNSLFPEEGKNRLVIFCGKAYEAWSPLSKDEGIGGSEEAVIYMAEQLFNLGWKVEVYNQCSAPATYNGVPYKPFDQYDSAVPCDVFIAWRLYEYIDFAPANAYKVLWAHDKHEGVNLPFNFMKKCNKIFVLSKYHREDFPDLPDEAFYITSNGIVPQHFYYLNDGSGCGERDLDHYIYASSPDRGLVHILNNWEEIKKINPKAVLHVFYGFNKVYDKLKDDVYGQQFKDQTLELLNTLPDVIYHGRVGHVELAEWFLRCGYLLYPCVFPEINCLTVLKSQAAGCWPICNDFAALKETVKYGSVAHGIFPDILGEWLDLIRQATIKPPSLEDRDSMAKDILENYSWEKIAKDWDKLFRENVK